MLQRLCGGVDNTAAAPPQHHTPPKPPGWRKPHATWLSAQDPNDPQADARQSLTFAVASQLLTRTARTRPIVTLHPLEEPRNQAFAHADHCNNE